MLAVMVFVVSGVGVVVGVGVGVVVGVIVAAARFQNRLQVGRGQRQRGGEDQLQQGRQRELSREQPPNVHTTAGYFG